MSPSHLELLLVSVLAFILSTTTATVLRTLNGQIRGFTETVMGTEVDIFLGIPYAIPPLGDLRFKAPMPVSNWTGIIDVLTPPNACMQSNDRLIEGFAGVEVWNANTNVSEDCLYLNIMAPRVAQGTKLTTMVWLYGGSFVYGSSALDIYDGRYLAAMNNVIFASMQYRMGVQGFVFTGTDDAPGNGGLRDQQLAFNWIYDNVESFGGDKSSICIFGESSGSASVGLHLLAPSSWTFFSHAIMQSASSFADWAVSPSENSLNKTKELAKVLGCPTYTSSEMMKCLRNVDAFVLEAKQWYLELGNIGTFSPTVDGRFIPDLPTTLVKSGRVKACNILTGVTKDEGTFFLPYFYPKFYPTRDLWNRTSMTSDQFREAVCTITGFSNDSVIIDTIIHQYYTSLTPAVRGSYTDAIDDIVGDIYFKCPVTSFAQAFSSLSPSKGSVYVYSFEFRTSTNPWPRWMGVMHAYEIESVMGLPFNPALNYTEADRNMSKEVMSLWTNFAKTGSPGPSWSQYDAEVQNYMVLEFASNLETKQGLRFAECQMWSDMIPKLQVLYNRINKEVNASSSASIHMMTILLTAVLTVLHQQQLL